ncbi:MAG TPA: N-6 DNA methylase, partial [Nitrososphaera sp.]|nr:N-6 DNA methylase [Nitrososphaera sp.]
ERAEMRSRKKKEDSQDTNRPPPELDHQKELVKLLSGLAGRHSHWKVFTDFCEMSAIALSNAVDLAPREKREARYLQIVKSYKSEELDMLARGLAHLTLALERGFSDVLGRTFHDLELHNKWAGQFFTPDDVCRMMARMTIGDTEELKARIAARGFVTTQEPAVGSGAMVIALAEAMYDAGINYQQHLHVTAIDVDLKCVHMAYAQLSLLHIPAVIIHGNTLAVEEYDHWYTPAHIMDGWRWKLLRREAIEEAHAIIAAPTKSEAAPVEKSPDEKPDLPRGQLKLF